METRSERIRAAGGGEFEGYVVLPDATGDRPGVLVLQEIFGVNGYIKSACRRVAELGYVAMAPDLFWRLQPGIAVDDSDEKGLQEGLAQMQRLDFPQAIEDSMTALRHLRGVSGVRHDEVGVLGFCLGGGLAFGVAANAEPATCVSYYGSAIPNLLEMADSIECPILFHFGGADQYFPTDKQALVREAFAGSSNAEFHVHEGAGHAFDNPSPLFHHEQAAREAWAQTEEFLNRTLVIK